MKMYLFDFLFLYSFFLIGLKYNSLDVHVVEKSASTQEVVFWNFTHRNNLTLI